MKLPEIIIIQRENKNIKNRKILHFRNSSRIQSKNRRNSWKIKSPQHIFNIIRKYNLAQRAKTITFIYSYYYRLDQTSHESDETTREYPPLVKKCLTMSEYIRKRIAITVLNYVLIS